MPGFLIFLGLLDFFLVAGFWTRFAVLERGTLQAAVKGIMYTTIGVSVCALAFAGGSAVSNELWGGDEQLAVDSESGTGSVGDEADGGELVDSEKEIGRAHV